MVGLGNVDNTSDINKPVSTATQTALNLKSNLASPTFTGTVTLPSVSFTSTPSSGTGTLLAINGSNQIITTSSSINQTAVFPPTASTYYLPFVASASTGAFVPLVNAGITCDPFNGLIRSNLITATNTLETFNMKITNVPAGTQTFLLAVDSGGNVIQGTALSALQQTRTSTNATFYVPFVSSFTTGTFTPLIENKLLFNPATGLLTTNLLYIFGNTTIGSLTFLTNPPTGTVAFYLAIDSTGAVIRTGSAGGDAYLANTQTFTGDNTFSGIVYASRIYAQNTGAVMEYDTRSNFAHQFKVNGNVLAQIGTLGLAVNNIVNLNAVNLVINGNGSGVIVLQASGTTVATIDGTGFNTNQINTYANADLNINVVDSTKFLNFNFNGSTITRVTNDGFWIPSNGGTSFYITDTAPRTGTTAYGRYFGFGVTATIYQDFYNRFMWRTTNLAGTGATDAMYLRSSGLNIPKSTSTHTTLDAYELVVGNNSAAEGDSAKIIIRGKASITTSGANKGPSIDFTAWDSHTTPQASIEVVDDNLWGGIFRLKAKANGAGANGALTEVLQARVSGFRFQADAQGGVDDCRYHYASANDDLYIRCQHESWMFNHNGPWVGGILFGYISKYDAGSKISWVASASQFTSGAFSMYFEIAFTRLSPPYTVYTAQQRTFTNIGGAHWVCPNIDAFPSQLNNFRLPADGYAVTCSGNAISDANDYVRVQIFITPA